MLERRGPVGRFHGRERLHLLHIEVRELDRASLLLERYGAARRDAGQPCVFDDNLPVELHGEPVAFQGDFEAVPFAHRRIRLDLGTQRASTRC